MKTEIYNHTIVKTEKIGSLDLLFTIRDNWRQRNVKVYSHPTDYETVISDGTAFDNSIRVICEDNRNHWLYELNQRQYGKTHFVKE